MQQKMTIKSIVVMSSSLITVIASAPAGPYATAWLREVNNDAVDKQTSRICNEYCYVKILKESRIVILKYLIYYYNYCLLLRKVVSKFSPMFL